MSLIVLERIPLPSLRTYTSFSVVLLSVSIYYAALVSSNPNWKVNATRVEGEFDKQNESLVLQSVELLWNRAQNESFLYQIQETASFMIQEPLCVWTLINMAYCCLLLLGFFIQKVVFGELRPSEQQHFKDKFGNFMFYKFIFVFGIVNIQYFHEVVFWCAWFSILGFLNLLTQLGKDRFEYLSFSISTSVWTHVRLLSLLIGIWILSGFMILVCVAVGLFGGFNMFAFMAAVCIQLNIQTLHVILKYSLYLYEVKEGDNSPTINWEKRGPVAYRTELFFELAVLLLDFVHHLHMLLWSNTILSIASFIICMQLRHLFREIQRRIKRHRNYVWVLNHIEKNYPMATAEELSSHKDNCAICWEEMDSARKLPCTHLFHNSCLQSWLEKDTSCPTCRTVLSLQNRNMLDIGARLEHSLDNIGDNQPGIRRQNHFFHFEGSSRVSWLPSFSVEVTHTQLTAHPVPAIQISSIDAMARQIQELFPHIPLSIVIDDLRLSRSMQLTIENILDGRVEVPAHVFESEPMPAPETPSETPSNEENSEDSVLEDTTSVAGNSKCGDSSTTVNSTTESSNELEKIFQEKKKQMIVEARRKYLEKRRKLKNLVSEES